MIVKKTTWTNDKSQHNSDGINAVSVLHEWFWSIFCRGCLKRRKRRSTLRPEFFETILFGVFFLWMTGQTEEKCIRYPATCGQAISQIKIGLWNACSLDTSVRMKLNLDAITQFRCACKRTECRLIKVIGGVGLIFILERNLSSLLSKETSSRFL